MAFLAAFKAEMANVLQFAVIATHKIKLIDQLDHFELANPGQRGLPSELCSIFRTAFVWPLTLHYIDHNA